MKEELYGKLATYDFKKLFASKGYEFFEKGIYNLNIIGVRSNETHKVTNHYDDYLVVDYNVKHYHKRNIYKITTDPGISAMRKPLNVKGTAILAPGQYKGAYCIDVHNGKYKALCQRLAPVKVYRDNNKDDIYDFNPATLESGMFGINIHRSNEFWTRPNIDGYSAGCQVFNDPNDFANFMNIVKKAEKIWGNRFTYTLIDANDLI